MLETISYHKLMEWVAFFELEEDDRKATENGKGNGRTGTSLV